MMMVEKESGREQAVMWSEGRDWWLVTLPSRARYPAFPAPTRKQRATGPEVIQRATWAVSELILDWPQR